jgi:hypothetical protein
LGTSDSHDGRSLYALLSHPHFSQRVHSHFTDQIAAALEGFFWPKIFWDFLTTNLDSAVKPVPILQTINLVFGIACLAYEWPLKFISGTTFHRSIEVRLMLLPLLALAAVIIYQGTNAAIYYLIGVVVYFWAYSEGEVCDTGQGSDPFFFIKTC